MNDCPQCHRLTLEWVPICLWWQCPCGYACGLEHIARSLQA